MTLVCGIESLEDEKMFQDNESALSPDRFKSDLTSSIYRTSEGTAMKERKIEQGHSSKFSMDESPRQKMLPIRLDIDPSSTDQFNSLRSKSPLRNSKWHDPYARTHSQLVHDKKNTCSLLPQAANAGKQLFLLYKHTLAK
ncbi:hypothetical protein Ciccas_014053 [Cichlidogyrus casuarinus]|uniref:Uncharacterized protein n=1 Tax=Cichlidogyrus casuarinus TaxID=1844966 RepID=A0ABD2PNW8_9PLAT